MRRIAADPRAKFIAGGTNLIDLMKGDVKRRLIDITPRLPLKAVEETTENTRIGALVPNSDLAYHPLIEQRYPMLASAILAGASARLREHGVNRRQSAATHALLLLLRHRDAMQWREPGSRCSALAGANACAGYVLGASAACICNAPLRRCRRVALASP